MRLQRAVPCLHGERNIPVRNKQKSRLWLLILLVFFSLTCTISKTPFTLGSPPAPTAGPSLQVSPPTSTASPIPQNTQFPIPPPTARIAFVATGWSVPGADQEIFVMNPDGTGITPISNSPGSDIEPTWSPDGKKLAFTSKRDGNFEIYIMNADGSGQARLTDSPEDDHYPAWSPDGSKIAFSSYQDAHEDLYVINVDGTGLARLTNTPDTNERYPDWSPDGKTILFSAFGGGKSGIFRMDPDGSNVRQIMAGPLHSPRWSPDGTQIAFDGEPAGCKLEIYIMDADGSNMRQITDHPKGCGGYNKHPGWSPDGKKIVYSSADRNPPSEPISPNIYVINIDGSGETALTQGVNKINYGGYDPAWSPIP
jgi:Tol biopolymer transport system component